jgi:cystathionine beta-lyase/cystathionine gamma-synthase
MSRFGVETSFVGGRDLEEIEESIKPTTSLIYLESPSSVIFSLQDLQGVVREAGRRGIITIIDNSCATPYNQHPLSYGIDLVVHTATKYLNGHSDVVSGAVVGRRELVEHIFTNERALLGGIPGPFEAWLLLRGIRTLGLRMERHNSSGLKIARFLENHPKVKRVYYPGLRSHPQHRLAARQMSGFSGLLSFDLGVTEKKVERLLDSLRLFYIAVSWGGFESLAVKASPAAPSDPDIPPNLIRLSIGLEEPEDLMEDLESALKKV